MGTKNNWKAQIKQVIDEPAGPGGRNRLSETVEEFVSTLNESRWLHAKLEQGTMPSLQTILLSPRTRRNEQSAFLSLWVTPYAVSVVGEQSREMKSPTDLKRFFVEFARRSELTSTIEEYRKRCSMPVRAALRTRFSPPHSNEDLTVLVDSGEQEMLVDALDHGASGRVSLTVVRNRPVPRNEDAVEYRFLDSAGVGLSLTEEPRREADASHLRLTGVPFQMSTAAPPLRLVANLGKCFSGSTVHGVGFVLTPEEMKELIAKDLRNSEVIEPYLTGTDLNTHPSQLSGRFVINFKEWPLERAEAFPDVLKHLEVHAKPGRLGARAPISSAPWWRFWRVRPSLYESIGDRRRVLARARISEHSAFVFVDYRPVFSDQVIVFVLDDWSSFAMLQSFAHEEWTVHTGATMRFDRRYVPADCFETFPFASPSAPLAAVGERYYEHRRSHMFGASEGLTKTYNRFHDPDERQLAIRELRNLHVEMDEAVARAYGWDDLRLDHGFHRDSSMVSFTIGGSARLEVRNRLLHLNRQRYAEQIAEGLRERPKSRGRAGEKGG